MNDKLRCSESPVYNDFWYGLTIEMGEYANHIPTGVFQFIEGRLWPFVMGRHRVMMLQTLNETYEKMVNE